MKWWGAYIGLPFGEKAGQVTCWSLVTKVYKEQLDITLPSYSISCDDVRSVYHAIKEGQEAEIWESVSSPREYDVVVMRHPMRSLVGHVGIMVDSLNVLHITQATYSIIVPKQHFSIRERIAGFRRYRCT